MKRYWAVPATVVCMLALLGCEGEARVEVIEPGADDQAQLAGDRVDSVTAYDVSGRLAEVVEAAAKVGTFDDLLERLSREDRDRLKQIPNSALDEEAKPFNEVWQSRFDTKFDITEPPAVFDRIVTIEAIPSSDERQRVRVTVLALPGEMDKPFEFGMVKERNWQVDLPDTVDPEVLQESLRAELRKFHQDPESLPGEPLEAQREVAHRVLAVLAGAGQEKVAETAGSAAPPAAPAPAPAPGQ